MIGGLILIPGRSPKQETGLVSQHRHPVEGGPESSASAEKTEVLRWEQGSSQDLLRHSGGLSSVISHSAEVGKLKPGSHMWPGDLFNPARKATIISPKAK